MRPMISFYAESASGNMMDTTAQQCAEKLERIFNVLESFGVTVEDESVEGISGTVLQKWVNSMKADHKISSINNYICIINPFLRWAFSMEYTDKDYSSVLHVMRLPKEDSIPEWERPKSKYYSKEQVDALLNSSSGKNRVRDRAIIALLLGSGLRVTELCSLTIGEYNRSHGSVYIKRKGNEWRHTEVADFVYDYVDAYLKTRPDANDDEPLFMTTHGQPCNRIQIYKCLSNKQKALDLAAGPHAIRHTFISEAEKVGGASVARDLANHKSLVVTNRYDHSSAEQRREAVNALPWGR